MAVQAQKQFLENPPAICNNGDNLALGWIDNRGGHSVDLYHLPQQKQQQQQQQAVMMAAHSTLANQQSTPIGFSSSPSSNRILPMDAAYSLASHMEKQKREIDQFLCLQRERFRVALQQQMKEHMISLMRRLESKAASLLRQKDEDLARASKKTAELEGYLKRAEAEGQTWQRIARENEAMALSLRNTLEQVCDNACPSSAGGVIAAAALGDDAASCCDSSGALGHYGGGIGAKPDGGQGDGVTGRCKGCGSHDSCMLFMPCMHLCACKLCDTLLDACPVCRSVKHGSVEVFFS